MQGMGLAQSLSEEEHQLLDELEDELARLDVSKAAARGDLAPAPPSVSADPMSMQGHVDKARPAPALDWRPTPSVLRVFDKLAALLLEDLRDASKQLRAIETSLEPPGSDGSIARPTDAHSQRALTSQAQSVDGRGSLPAPADAEDPMAPLRERLAAIRGETTAELDLYALRERPTELKLLTLPPSTRLGSDLSSQSESHSDLIPERTAKPPLERDPERAETSALGYRAVRALLSMWLEAPQGGRLSQYLLRANTATSRPTDTRAHGLNTSSIAPSHEDSPGEARGDEEPARTPLDVDKHGAAALDDAIWLAWLRAAQLGPVHAALLAEQADPALAKAIPALPPASLSLRAFALACRRRFAVEQRASALAVDASEHLELARRICATPRMPALDCVRAFDERLAEAAASRAEARRLRRFGVQRAVLFVLLLGFSLYMLVFR